MADNRGTTRRSSHRGPQRTKPCQRSRVTSSKLRSTTPRRNHPPTPRARNAIKTQSCVTSLPTDLWTLLLPFLTWRDTAAMRCVCVDWKSVVNEAKKLHPEWRSTVLGPSSNGAGSLELLRTNHLSWADTRFTPDLVLLSATSKDPSPWHSGGYWEQAIAAIEEAKLLPPTCRIVGVFTMNAVLGRTDEVEEEAGDSAVTLSISVAHLPETTVEMAEFERKELRQCSRGVELENPFTSLEVGDSPSFLLFGVNDQSAGHLVPAIEQWHAGAAVVGAVSPLVDRCVPVATYRQGREAQSSRKRKTKGAKQQASQRRPRPRGQVAFPSTMLLRLNGKVGIKALSSSGYHPLTPVVRCERADTAELLSQVVTYDLVSTLRPEAEQVRLVDLLEPSERLAIESEGRALNIFSCRESAPLQHLFGTNSPLPAPLSSPIDRLEFVFWLQDRVMSLSSACWQQGAYGVLASHHPTRTTQALTRALRNTQAALSSKERAFGAFLVAGALNEVEDPEHSKQVHKVCTDVFRELQVGGCLVSSSVGPVAFPGGRQAPGGQTTTQVQTQTTCGAILYAKT